MQTFLRTALEEQQKIQVRIRLCNEEAYLDFLLGNEPTCYTLIQLNGTNKSCKTFKSLQNILSRLLPEYDCWDDIQIQLGD